MEEKFYCSACGEELSEDEIYEFNGDIYCEACLDDLTNICDRCGERFSNDDVISDGETCVCQSCFEDYYIHCDRCGSIIRRDDSYMLETDDYSHYCSDCYWRESAKLKIHDYSYKPEPVFHGDGSRYIGVEIEADEGGKDEENAEEILDIANTYSEENIYIKSDGSLYDGFEIVSHPMTLQYHKEVMPWKKVLKGLISLDYLSHKTSTCGLHCHINKDSLGVDKESIDETVAKIIFFVEKNWDKLLIFSRRTENQMKKWANRYGTKEKPKDFIMTAKTRSCSRYTCINLNNYHTVEIRIFRGTLKYNTFIATLELVNEICNLCVSHTDDEIEVMTWTDFVNYVDREENSELITYLKERNLYETEEF